MDDKEPFINAGLVSYLWVIGVSLWAGVVSYFEKKEPFSWVHFLAHLSSSSFAGLMTFFLCQYGDVPGPLTGVFCGIAAHMGTPALLRMRIIRQFLDKEMDMSDKDKK